MVDAFRQGLKETGYVEGQNVAIEYRWAEGRLSIGYPRLAADLVRRQVLSDCRDEHSCEISWQRMQPATIPIVFTTGSDPVQLGLVANLSDLAAT